MVNLLEKYRGLNLKSDVRTDSLMEPDDIYETKLALNKTGHYEEPEWGLSKFTDEALFSGIKSFQKENNLKIDGIMKPGGETEEKLNNIMATNSKEKLQEFNGDYVNKLFAENKQKELDKNKKMSGREIVEKSLKIADKFSKPNVMNFAGKNKTSSEGVNSEDSEGFLSGIGEMFSKLGEKIGIGDDNKTDGTNLNIDYVAEKLPIITSDDIKGGFENIKIKNDNYSNRENGSVSEVVDIVDNIKNQVISVPELTKLAKKNNVSESDIKDFMNKYNFHANNNNRIGLDQARSRVHKYSKEFNSDEFKLLNKYDKTFKNAAMGLDIFDLAKSGGNVKTGKISNNNINDIKDIAGVINKPLKRTDFIKYYTDIINGINALIKSNLKNK